jgi:mono/diheme cytochrome c family protein
MDEPHARTHDDARILGPQKANAGAARAAARPCVWSGRFGSRAILGSCAGVIAALVFGSAGCASSRPAEEITYDGAELFARYCASCHGASGAGNGPMARYFADALPDLRTLAARNGGPFPRERIAAIIEGSSSRSIHGDSGMPVWGYHFSREEGTTAAGTRRVRTRIDALVVHIESLQQPVGP